MTSGPHSRSGQNTGTDAVLACCSLLALELNTTVVPLLGTLTGSSCKLLFFRVESGEQVTFVLCSPSDMNTSSRSVCEGETGKSDIILPNLKLFMLEEYGAEVNAKTFCLKNNVKRVVQITGVFTLYSPLDTAGGRGGSLCASDITHSEAYFRQLHSVLRQIKYGEHLNRTFMLI